MISIIKELISFANKLDDAGLVKQASRVEKLANELFEAETEMYDDTFETGLTTPPEDYNDHVVVPEDDESGLVYTTDEQGQLDKTILEQNPIGEIMEGYLEKVYAMSVNQVGWDTGREMPSSSQIDMKELDQIAAAFAGVDSDFVNHGSYLKLIQANKDLIDPGQLYDAILSKLMAKVSERGEPFNVAVARSVAEWALHPVKIYIDDFYSKEDPSFNAAMIERAMPILASRIAGVPMTEVRQIV